MWENGSASCWGAPSHQDRDSSEKGKTETLCTELATGVTGLENPLELVANQARDGRCGACVIDGNRVRCWGKGTRASTSAPATGVLPHDLILDSKDFQPYWIDEIGVTTIGGEKPANVYASLSHARIHASLTPVHQEAGWTELDVLVGKALANHAAAGDVARVAESAKQLAPKLSALHTAPRAQWAAVELVPLIDFIAGK